MWWTGLRCSESGCEMSVPTTMIGVMDTDEDLDSRAVLYRVVQQAAPLHRILSALPDAAASRIGLTAGDLDRLSRLTSRALWASTSDLHERGEHEYAARVVERAAELEGEL
jgi:hypothetical protein